MILPLLSLQGRQIHQCIRTLMTSSIFQKIFPVTKVTMKRMPRVRVRVRGRVRVRVRVRATLCVDVVGSQTTSITRPLQIMINFKEN